MWGIKTARRILRWGGGLLVLLFLLFSYLAGSNDYMSDAVAFKCLIVLAIVMALILIQYLIVTDKKQRKELIVAIALSTAF